MLAYGHQKHVTEYYTEIGLHAQSMETSVGSIGKPIWRADGMITG
jgi:hypothetical protein